MTPKQKAAIKYNIKQKYLHGEITLNEYESMVAQLQGLANAGATLQEANNALGMYSGKAAKPAAQPAKAAMSMNQLLELETKLANKLNAHEITSTAYLDAMDKLQEMYNKKASFEEAKAAAGLGPAIMQTDPGTQATDQAVAKLEKELKKIYGDASKEMQKQLQDFLDEHNAEIKQLEMEFINGTISAEEHKKLLAMKMKQRMLKENIDQLTGVTLNANQKALAMINKEQLGVFAENASWQSFQISKAANLNLMFSIYDESTVKKLIMDKPELLPRKVVNGKKDKAWNRKQIAGAVTRAVIQGESIPKLAKRIAEETGETNMKAMTRYARTAMTAAQNSGRQEMLERAKGMGIKAKKVWMATLDSRTRDSHAALDGEAVETDKKFSNGLMYPGDPNGPPGEVYNCRCTLVYEYEGFPHDPVADQRLMYDEWDEEITVKEKDKNGKEHEKKKVIHHRDSKMIQNMTYKEWKAAKEGGVLNDLNIAKVSLAEAQKAVIKAKVNESKVYEGLWKDPVTLADFEAKKAGIQAKKDYYAAEIQKYEDAQANGASWATDEKIKDLKKKQKQLAEYEKNGQLIEKRNAALAKVQDLYIKAGLQQTAQAPAVAQTKTKKTAKATKTQTAAPTMSLGTSGAMATPFGAEVYTKERKDKALWTTNKKKVDSMMRSRTGEVWRAASDIEKDAIYEYTQSYHKFNEPLRGIEYGTNVYKGVGKTDLNAGGRRNGRFLDAMTDIIDKCSYDHDQWLQRGVGFGGMDKFFGCSEHLLRYGSEKELQDALLGTTPTEYGFMSMGSAKGNGFSGNILMNIYAPAGTKMMYVEPFSAFSGSYVHRSWDGVTGQSGFGHEFETIMQQGTQFRITKVEKSGGQIFVDMEVINQDNQQRWKKK